MMIPFSSLEWTPTDVPVNDENEAFFLRISRKGDYFYEGADIGIIVVRGRLMTDKFNLKPRAKKWINAIKSHYQSEPISNTNNPNNEVLGIGGFKMM